jgi:heme exporter protein B
LIFFLHTLAHLRKDLRLEWRSRDSTTGMLFFSLLVVVVFSLAFEPTAAVSRQIAGGILWIVILFAATTALNQSWTREQRNGVLDAHRLAPSSAGSLFLGKALANFVFVTAVELVLAPLFIVFYNLHALGRPALLLLVLPLGTWALVINGTFFAALGLRTRNRELMLPLVLFPISIPALLAMVQATTNILTGEYEPNLWIRLLFGYDIIFTTACLMLFETILNAE